MDKNTWKIKCDNCLKEYEVSEEKDAQKEELQGEKKLILKSNPQCPYCNTQNSRIASKAK